MQNTKETPACNGQFMTNKPQRN